MADNKTQPTNNSVADFLAGVSEQKRQDSATLIALMQDISGKKPVLWGPSIIGFDSYHYKYASGREGDAPVLGFSPRKTKLTIYLVEGFASHTDLLSQLGKFTTSVSCLYVSKLADVDIDVLYKLLERSYANKPLFGN